MLNDCDRDEFQLLHIDSILYKYEPDFMMCFAPWTLTFNVYLTSLAKHELYYESYDMVAVMFASLKNFELTLPNLRVLNEIISEFDQILSYYRDKYRVEKIKIVGSTYMAACGLDVQIGLNIKNETRSHDSLIQEVQRARFKLAAFQKKHYSLTDEKEEVVFVLTTFALDLMRTLWVCNNDYRNIPIDRDVFNADMSIGISSGEVMAGVVGASQVQYDIWGHAANMASRMDSTGVAGKIHVTQNTALILRKYGIECKYRVAIAHYRLHALVVGAKMDAMMEDELQAFARRSSLQRSPQQQQKELPQPSTSNQFPIVECQAPKPLKEALA
ncbi:hypothetical protein AWZ03_014539 [Drosophila navojoa]|uniref:adenylate cyclase n=1 Tax=Drosophila navojoa TaxID=7232 RepID=A0A484AR68_DRONA|nr:hypothetical protein AWZ03_014539 [Drosophila navojoa]